MHESQGRNPIVKALVILRILARYEVKIAKICNFWTFWPVLQLINHLFKIRQKALITGLNVQKMQNFAIFASYLASIVKPANHAALFCEKT